MQQSLPLMIQSRKLALVLTLWLLFALRLCGAAAPLQASPPTSPPADHVMGRRLKEKGLPNFGEVTPNLYRGGQPSPEGIEKLAKMGVDIVVDTGRSKRDKEQIKKLGMQYVPLPWYCPFPKEEVFARFLELIRNNPDKKIFVHCRLGDDRTGMMIASYRMAMQGWSAEEAMKEMQLFGYTTVHHLMCPGLAGYEKSFPERLKTSPEFREQR